MRVIEDVLKVNVSCWKSVTFDNERFWVFLRSTTNAPTTLVMKTKQNIFNHTSIFLLYSPVHIRKHMFLISFRAHPRCKNLSVTLTNDVKRIQNKEVNVIDPNPNNSYKTKKNFNNNNNNNNNNNLLPRFLHRGKTPFSPIAYIIVSNFLCWHALKRPKALIEATGYR